MSTSILGVIQHYQRSIEKCQTDEARLLHCISKLYKLPIKVEHLQETGIGKTVNSLRKFDGEIGTAAKTLVAKWKAMVAAEEEPMETSCNQDDNNSNGKDNDSDEDDDDDHKDHNKNLEINGNNNKSHSETKNQQSSSKDSENRGDKKQRVENEHSSKHSSSSKSHHRSTKSSPHKEVADRKNEDKSSSSSSKNKNSTSDEHHRSHKKSEKSDRNPEKSKDSSSNKQNTTPSSSHKSSKVHKEESLNANEDHLHNSKKEKKSHTEEKGIEYHADSVKDENRSSSSSKEKERNSHRHDTHKHEKHKSSSKGDRSERSEKHKTSKEHHGNRDDESEKKKHGYSSKHSSKSSSSKTEKDKPSSSAEDSSERKRKLDSEQDSNKKSPKAKIPKHNKEVEENVEEEEDEQGIDSSMGANFADVLGMLNMPGKKLKKGSSTGKSPTAGASTSSGNKSGSSRSSLLNGMSPSTSSSMKKLDTKPALLSASTKLEPLDPSIVMELPTISTNYRPLPLSQNVLDVVFPSSSTNSNATKPPVRTLTDAEALSHGISSKTMRTKIYSGVRTGQLVQVPSLFDLCIRILQKNIDALEYTGGVPFEVLRPVLERASPQQLLVFEEYNPYLMEDCDVLWQQHVQRHYRAHKRQEMESWREMFLRCQEDQERKLNILAESIKQSQKIISAPVRKTQLAFVDSMVKPPRNVQRKQEQFGTKSKLTATPASRVAALSSVTPNAAKTGDARLRVAASVRDNAQVVNIARPLKKAPLMAKTLQFMRGRHKR